MIKRPANNEKGFTLIEMLIAMAIGVTLMAVATYTYSRQSDVIRFGNQTTQARGMTRLALDELVTEIRRAGYGMPPGNSVAGRPARGISNATATTITFMANLDNVSAFTSIDSTNVNSTGLAIGLPIADTTDFAVGDEVVFFDTATPSKWNAYAIASKADFGGTSTLLGWGGGKKNDYAFEPIEDNTSVVVNKYHTITYTFNSGPGTITLTDDGGNSTNTTTTVAENVTDVTFSYFDASGGSLTGFPLDSTELGNVRRINISVQIVSPIEPDKVIETFDTDVVLRNMGT